MRLRMRAQVNVLTAWMQTYLWARLGRSVRAVEGAGMRGLPPCPPLFLTPIQILPRPLRPQLL